MIETNEKKLNKTNFQCENVQILLFYVNNSVSTLDLDSFILCCCRCFNVFFFCFVHFISLILVFFLLCLFCLKLYMSRNETILIESPFRNGTNGIFNGNSFISVEICNYLHLVRLIQLLDVYYGYSFCIPMECYEYHFQF